MSRKVEVIGSSYVETHELRLIKRTIEYIIIQKEYLKDIPRKLTKGISFFLCTIVSSLEQISIFYRRCL